MEHSSGSRDKFRSQHRYLPYTSRKPLCQFHDGLFTPYSMASFGDGTFENVWVNAWCPEIVNEGLQLEFPWGSSYANIAWGDKLLTELAA